MSFSVIWLKEITVKLSFPGGIYKSVYYEDDDLVCENYNGSYEYQTIPGRAFWNIPILNENSALAGWTVRGDSSGKLIESLDDFSATKDTTLDAVWTDGYKVTLDGSGGKFGDSNKITFRVEKGKSIDFEYFNLYKKPYGYLLKGWFNNTDNYPAHEDIIPTSDTILYADLKRGWSVTLWSNGGDVYWGNEFWDTNSGFGIELEENESIPSNYNGHTFKYNGKVLLGWTENPYNYNMADVIDIKGMKSKKDIELWAVWEDKDNVFKDVSSNSIGVDEIMEAYEYGVVGGYGTIGNLSYKPNRNVTRAQFAIMLYKLGVYNDWIDEDDPIYGNGFTDMSPSDSGYKEVMWAESHGVISGFSNGKFKPTNPITRQQLTLMLQRFGDLYGIDVYSGSKSISGFVDSAKVNNTFRSSVEWAYGQGILSGKKKNGQNIIDPNGSATRAQCAMFVMRFQHKIMH